MALWPDVRARTHRDVFLLLPSSQYIEGGVKKTISYTSSDKRREAILRLSFSALFVLLITAISTPSTFAQSQALNGQIEGTVSDENYAAVPNVVITVTNIETGVTRTSATDESGVYRFPLLPLGTYRITAQAANFKRHFREGITLSTGQTATVDLPLRAGEVREVVTVYSDSSIADAGKTDLGRVVNNREVLAVPLITRSPYNFALLQANVTGRPSRGFANPMVNANGYARRVNYLLDGNTNTQADRGSIRLMLISDTYISEIQLVANGFAAEFGNTPGLIMNVVTPSGTNAYHGSIGYRFRRPSFYSRPFFYPTADLPDNKADHFTATMGGPIIKDRWHFYFGYENGKRDDKAAANRLLTIRPEDRARLIATGLPASIFPSAIPFFETGPFYLFRNDAQMSDKNRLTVRFNHSDLKSKNFIQGGLNTLQRNIDAFSVDYGLAVQLASFTPQILNEFRFQYVHRTNPGPGGIRTESSGTGPSIVITGVANFGSPEGTSDTFRPLRIIQFQDNLTRTAGTHVVKFGGGFNFYNDTPRATTFSRFVFPSIDTYIAARNGNPLGYTSYTETFGESEIDYKANFWNFFAQDDWKLTQRLKINYGLRYDLYKIPSADSTSLFPASQRFKVDKNNFAARLGGAFAWREGDRPTILRGGAGIYYDQPSLAMYQRALQNNGSPRYFSLSFSGNANGATIPSPNAPAFPNTFSGFLPAGSVLPPQNIDTIAPEFETMYAIHANFQLEQEITRDTSFTLGYVYSSGRHLPTYRGINMIPIRFLADGRPVFSKLVNPLTRFDPRFNNILMVESVGVSEYDALTLQLTKWHSRGLQFSLNYTLSKAMDDAPEQNLSATTVQNLILSNPYDRRLDKGNSFADQRHTFVMSMVGSPKFDLENATLGYLLNHNQFGIIATANSGETFNIVSGSDINNDGVTGVDRPVGIKRNSGRTPPQFNVDLRYSRIINFTERYKLEVFGEFQNLFNVNSIVGFSNVSVTTNVDGELVGGLPDFKARGQSVSQDSRQFQLGFRFSF